MASIRLDRLLVLKYPAYSRSFWQKFIRSVGVLVKGHRITKPHQSVLESAAFELSEKELNHFLFSLTKAESAYILEKDRILYEEKTFIVIDKPSGVPTERIAFGYYPVHRLDKDTSGILVLAKDSVTQAKLQKQWKARKVKKTYYALVKGLLKPARGAIEGGISRSVLHRNKMVVSDHPRARSAYTEYKVLHYSGGNQGFPHELVLRKPLPEATLVSVFPQTGRTHQIRVHLSSIRHPVIGDSIYGERKLNKYFAKNCGLLRQFLHAGQLRFSHPKTKKSITIRSPLAGDLKAALRFLQLPLP